jgi:hypothetical protein
MRERYVIGRQDFEWSGFGDFIVSGGDITDTRRMKGLGFIEEVELRVKSSFGDWKLEEDKGANLESYRGRMNNKTTWESITNSMTYSLTQDSFLSNSEFKVFVAPVSHNEVAIRIDFSDNIKLKIDERLHTIRMIYNLDGQGPFIMR